MNANIETKPATKRGWLKKIGIVVAGLFVLLIIAFFVVTSSGFIKGVILPRVGKSMNATLTAEEVKLSPFSQLHLRGVKLQTTGTEPLLTVTEFRTRYSLMAILGGTMKVEEVLIESPVVTVVQTEDGKLNTDPLMEGAAPAEEPSASGAAPQVDLKAFNLKNATLRYVRLHPGGSRDVFEVSGLNVTLADVKNGAAGKFSFAMDAKVELNPPDVSQRGAAAMKHDGEYMFTLGPDLMPTQISGSDKLDITTATGVLAELAGAGLDFTAELTPTELKGVVMSFRKAGTPLGAVRVAGPFDAAKLEGKLTLTLEGIDRRLLNLAGGPMGMDFVNTRVHSTNVIEITQGGDMIALNGRFGLAELQVKQAEQTSPQLELASDYQLSADVAKSVLRLQSLNLVGQQAGRPFLRSELSAPMTLSWGDTAAGGAGDATLGVALTGFNVADWRAFIGDALVGGTVDATVKLHSQEAGQKLGVEAVSTLQNLAMAPGADTYSAKVELKSTIRQHKDAMTVTGTLTVADLTSRLGSAETKLPLTQVEFEMKQTGDVIELPRVLTRLVATERAKNELLLTGRVDMTKPEAITGSIKLAADTLDLTAYYDLVMGMTNAAPMAPGGDPVDPNKEPDAMTLPFSNFVCDLNIGRLYLHEVDIRNWQTSVRLDGGRVLVKPVQLTLNGAPVTGSADVDLSVPGFKYAVDFNAPGVPLAPLVNSLLPERKGQMGGTLTAAAKLQGAGVTGANLQKNLAGNFDFVTTNLNLSLSEARMPVIKSLINVVVAIPDAIRNPSSAVGNLLGNLLGSGQPKSGGVVDEFMKSPLNAIVVRGVAGGGKIELKQALLESMAFRADAAGTIEIAKVLTNSIMRFPVSVALGKSISDKLGLTPANTASNAVYVALPDFVKMRGTLGLPKPDVNYVVLAQLALRSGGGILGNTGGAVSNQTGGALGALGGLLGGTTATNTPPGTNAVLATNAPTTDLIRGIGGLLRGGKKQETNAPTAP